MHPVVGNPFIKREGASLPSEGSRIKIPRLHHFATGGGHTTIALRHRVSLRACVQPKRANSVIPDRDKPRKVSLRLVRGTPSSLHRILTYVWFGFVDH